MALPTTQWFKQWHVADATAANTAASDRPDWDTDAIAFLPYSNSFVTGAYNADTNTGYGVAPWTGSNFEALTVSGQYTQGTGFPLASRSVSVASGKILYTCSADLVIQASTIGAANLTLTYTTGSGFQGGIIVDRTTTTKWILGVYNFGAEVPILDPNTATIHWATSPAAGTLFHWE